MFSNHVTGGVRTLLRLEATIVMALAFLCYAHFDFSLSTFFIFFLAPDIALLAYLIGTNAGAFAYNATHSYIAPLMLLAFHIVQPTPVLFQFALIWLAHIGFDRALGYGLKYKTAFRHTHLGLIGKIKKAL